MERVLSIVRSDLPEDKDYMRFYVHENPSHIHLFYGPYIQCLIYVGAVTLGKEHDIAQKFAKGIYVWEDS